MSTNKSAIECLKPPRQFLSAQAAVKRENLQHSVSKEKAGQGSIPVQLILFAPNSLSGQIWDKSLKVSAGGGITKGRIRWPAGESLRRSAADLQPVPIVHSGNPSDMKSCYIRMEPAG